MAESKNQGATNDPTSGAGNTQSAADDVRRAFAGLPLDEKVATLIQVELDMLGDAVSSVVSAVSKAVDDVARACESSEPSKSAAPGAGSQGPTS